jgi:hypothetical protein
MNIRPAGAELFHDEGQTDRHYEATCLFRNYANAPQYIQLWQAKSGKSSDANINLKKRRFSKF